MQRTLLSDGLGGHLVAANALKSGQEWFQTGGGSAPNGFEALPGGQRMNAGISRSRHGGLLLDAHGAESKFVRCMV